MGRSRDLSSEVSRTLIQGLHFGGMEEAVNVPGFIIADQEESGC